MTARPRLSPDHHDNCTYAVSVDWDAAQVTLEGPPIGPGGGASLTCIPGIELVFDRVAGQLSQVVVEAGEPLGRLVPDETTLACLGRVLGDRAAAAVRHALCGTVPPVTLRPAPAAIAALSRLARLKSAWRTSPWPCSPLWALEAAGLARQGRLPSALSFAWPSWPSIRPRPVTSKTPSGNIEGWLDPALVPSGVFRYGLSPDSDLDIRVDDGEAPLITVEVTLTPDQGRAASCQVRLVDSGARRVLSAAPLRPDGLRGRAELRAPAGLRAATRHRTLAVEVVGDGSRPVWGTRLRRMRRALRWADAALRAAGRPAGLDPDRTDEQWAGLAALAWDRCRADWTAAGDASRAAVAARLVREPVRWTRPYLAEATCDPAASRDA